MIKRRLRELTPLILLGTVIITLVINTLLRRSEILLSPPTQESIIKGFVSLLLTIGGSIIVSFIFIILLYKLLE